jgi:hypothetical protein
MFKDEDEQAVQELTHIANLYMRRGDLEKAEEVMSLVQDILRRKNRERNQDHLRDQCG